MFATFPRTEGRDAFGCRPDADRAVRHCRCSQPVGLRLWENLRAPKQTWHRGKRMVQRTSQAAAALRGARGAVPMITCCTEPTGRHTRHTAPHG